MKKLTWVLSLAAVFMLLSFFKVNAQKVKLETGDFSQLKGQTVLNVEYTYDNLKVGKKDENVYIKEKVADYNKDEPGKGDKWLTNWKNDRSTRYQPKFEGLMNEYMVEKGIKVGADNKAKYTITVKTLMIEPGFNIGIMRQDAFINVEITLAETANPSGILAKVTMDNVPGRTFGGYDFDTGVRIEEAYAKCGKELAKLILKKAFK